MNPVGIVVGIVAGAIGIGLGWLLCKSLVRTGNLTERSAKWVTALVAVFFAGMVIAVCATTSIGASDSTLYAIVLLMMLAVGIGAIVIGKQNKAELETRTEEQRETLTEEQFAEKQAERKKGMRVLYVICGLFLAYQAIRFIASFAG